MDNFVIELVLVIGRARRFEIKPWLVQLRFDRFDSFSLTGSVRPDQFD